MRQAHERMRKKARNVLEHEIEEEIDKQRMYRLTDIRSFKGTRR